MNNIPAAWGGTGTGTPPPIQGSSGGSITDVCALTFHGGTETYIIRSDGSIYFANEGQVIGSYDWNTGVMSGLNGEFLGSMSYYNDGSSTFTAANGEIADGTYNGSLTPPKEPFDIPTGQPTSYGSGIDWSSPVAKELLEALLGSAQNLPNLAAEAGPQALEFYKNIANQSMGIQGFQGLMNELGGRNMLTSSVAENSLANAQAQTQQSIADKAFTASLASTQAQMGVPGSLSSIISQLGGQVGSTTDPYSGYSYLLSLLGY